MIFNNKKLAKQCQHVESSNQQNIKKKFNMNKNHDNQCETKRTKHMHRSWNIAAHLLRTNK